MAKKYLYVIKSGSGLIKVGVSQNADVRQNQIRTGSGHSTEQLFVAGPFNNATRLEGSIHKRLDEFRKFGEWFLCDEKIVILAAQELSLEFVDKPDVSEEDSARIQAQFIKELLTDPVDRVISSFDASLEKLMSSYQESVSLNESLSAQYQEACELLDWYGTELKDVLFMAKKAMDQVKRLELQVQKLKEKNSEEEIA